jgi:hypothetical protein
MQLLLYLRQTAQHFLYISRYLAPWNTNFSHTYAQWSSINASPHIQKDISEV